ncbi:hypothetical protein SG0102_04720 [Intestinibaculum porci]|uniref:Prealbumin-like fold domain-containing protein n=1 Tax=Intestinibaculum porci TaxID=2487118 RepID=A0A3G9JMV0_9FIRM|nr:SpaA isopeptide-forming pilin-related protein [Intestinibaculum porci]BBH25538.1 hypothetical protein SG0102_04720 [Intestinibaculum porci]
MTNTEKTYTNTATWGDSKSSQETTVTRTVKEISKGVEQNGSNLEYSLEINPAGKDLNPGADTLTLDDTLTIPNDVKAYLDLESIKLYRFDHSKDKHRGVIISPSLYKFKYDSKNHKIHVELQDRMPCVLVYTYTIVANKNGNYYISNNANLAGVFDTQYGDNFNINLSSASGSQSKVVLTKVDEDNSTKLLSDAGFSIEKREKVDGKWTWVWQDPKDVASTQAPTKEVTIDQDSQVKKNVLVTGSDKNKGKISFTKLSENALYRIKEVSAPEGYRLSDQYYYVIKKEKDGNITEDNLINNLDTDVKKEIDASQDQNKIKSKINFFESTGGSFYVSNKYARLTINKSWVDKDGNVITPTSNEVSLSLYRYKLLNENSTVNVKVNVTNLQYKNETFTLTKGSKIIAKITDINDLGTIKDENGINYGKTYVMGPFSSDTDVNISIENGGYSLKFESVAPSPILDKNNGEFVGNIKLLKDKNWIYSDDNLPSQDDKGNKYVYAVKETSIKGESMSDYKVIYMGNYIQAGTINVTNQETGDKKYTLPSTGGIGTKKYYLLGTLLSMLGVIYILMKLGKGGLFRKEDHS